MKKLILLLSIAQYFSMPANGQWIQSLYTVPANPTTGDAISVVAQVSFSTGSCNQKTSNVQTNGNYVFASALHCVGPLTYICDDTDSFYVGLLPAGNYVFVYHVDAGGAPSPCTAGIVPGPTDSISFTVTAVTGIDDNSPRQDFTYVVAGNTLSIKTLVPSYTACIYNAAGQKIHSNYLKGDTEIDLIRFSKGIYTILTFNEEKWNRYRFMVF